MGSSKKGKLTMQRLDFNTGWHFSCPDGRDFDVTLPLSLIHI